MKVRVYQLARDLKVSSDALVHVITELTGQTKSHMSALDEALQQQIKERFDQERAAVKKEFAVREKKRPELEPKKPTDETKPRLIKPAPKPAEAPAARPEPGAPEPASRAPGRTPAPASAPKPIPGTGPLSKPKPPVPPTRAPEKKRPTGPVRLPEQRPPSPGRPAEKKGGPRTPPGRTPRQQPRSQPLGMSRTPPQRGRGPGQAQFVTQGTIRRPPPRTGRKKKKKGRVVDEGAVRDSVRRTMHAMESGGRRGKRRRRSGGGVELSEEETNLLRVHEFATVGELASVMESKPNEVIAACLQMGILANINKQLDKDEITAILDEFGFEPDFVSEYGAEALAQEEIEVEGQFDSETRAPIVTVMGHVDHGKTTLLDYIRHTHVTEQESGGITQHIGAYRVELEKGTITFLDTPGHEAFSAMRARGTKVTDAVVLVVAANDEVRPQTVEAINHAKAAGVPIIVAINKIDVAGANPDNIRKGLADAGVQVEEWGGDTVSCEISAKHGDGVDKLLEMIVLVSELAEFKAEPDRPARGAVIESKRDSGRGVVATVLVQNGTLRIGDPFVCGPEFGKVRALFDAAGNRVKEAGPSTPIEVLGWSGVPQAGDSFAVVQNEAKGREIAAHRTQIQRLHEHRLARQVTSLVSFQERIKRGEAQDLNIVIKADVAGSVEVLRDKLQSLSTDEVTVRIIHTGVGLINESDVLLAIASKAIIIGFHTRTDSKAHQLGLNEDVDIRLYRVIYEVEKEIKDAMAGLLAPEKIDKDTGSAEVRMVFEVSKVGSIAGCMVVSGTIHRDDRARLYRGVELVFDGQIGSLKRLKDDAKEVQSGFECGIGLQGHDDVREGDVIEAYKVEEVARTID